MTLPRGRDRQGNQGREGEEGGQPAPAEDGEPEIGQVRCQGDKAAAALPRLGPVRD
jgi:hypothetical protein